MAIGQELGDELLKDYSKPEDIIGESGLLKAVAQSASGTGVESADDPPSGLRAERRSRRKWRHEPAKRGPQKEAGLPKTRIFSFCFAEDRYVRIGVFPEPQKFATAAPAFARSPDKVKAFPSCKRASAPIGSANVTPR